jgi:hypothetical protein
VPKIPTTYDLVTQAQRHKEDGTLELLSIEQPGDGEEIKNGEKVMILIREFYVRDNHEGS